MKKVIIVMLPLFLLGSQLMAQNDFPSSGMVAIGTTTPTARLHVRGDVSNSSENWIFKLQNDNTEYLGQPTVGMLFAGGDVQSQKAGIIFRRTGGYGVGNLYFLNNNKIDTSFPTIENDAVMTLFTGGNIGMGTVNPQNSLEISRWGADHGIRLSRIGLSPGYVSLEVHSNGKGVFSSQQDIALNAGSFNALTIQAANGYIGIGTNSPKEQLSVNGNIRSKEIKVETSNWPDYVFKDNYDLMPLKETEVYINKNKHLPEIPGAEQAELNGINLGEMNKLLLKKIEELTLHLISQEKRIDDLRKEVLEIGNNKIHTKRK